MKNRILISQFIARKLSILTFALLLLSSFAASAATLYFDADGSSTNNSSTTGAGLGGTNNWSTALAYWWSGTGADVVWTEESDPVFWGTAGTVTLSGPRTANSLNFKTAGYTIATNSTLTLSGNPSIITVPSGSATFIHPTLIGTNGYTITGGGIVVFDNAANGISGNITINGATLDVNTQHPLGGGSGTINFLNGTLENDDTGAGDGVALSYQLALGAGGGTLDMHVTGQILVCAPLISGTGSLTKTGIGELRFTGANGNTFTGGLVVSGGIVTASTSTNIGTNTMFGAIPAATLANAITIQNGSELRLAGGTNVTLDPKQGITLGTGGGAIDAVSGRTFTIPSVVSGAAPLSINAGLNGADPGTILLSGSNTYSGKTTISNGVLSVASVNKVSGGTAGSSLGAPTTVANGTISIGTATTAGTLIYTGVGETTDRVIDLAGTINGAVIEQDGSGSLNLTSALTASGVGAKTLTLQGSNTASNVISGKIVDSSSGATSVLKTGVGTWTLAAANTYSGTTTLNTAGLLNIANALALSTNTFIINQNGFFDNTSGADLTISNSITLTGGSPTYNGSANNMTINGLASIAGANRTITVIAHTLTLKGGITQDATARTLTKAGSGTLALLGTNSYTSNTVVSAGTLALGPNASLASLTNTLAAGATLDVSAQTTFQLTGTLAATGTASPATIIGGTTVNFSNRPVVLTYDGSHPALVISAGTLSLSGNTITVNGTALAPGSYAVIQSAGGVTSSGTLVAAGTAIGTKTGTIVVSASSVNLVISETPVITPTVTSASTVYGSPSVALSGTIVGAGAVYPASNETVAVTINGNTQFTTTSDALGDFSIAFNSAAIPYSSAPYTITYSYGGDSFLNPATNSTTGLTVGKATLTVLANSTNATYGAGNPAFTASYSNFVNGDTAAVISGNPGLSSTRSTTSPVAGSPYVITATAGSLSAANYTFSFVNGALTVNPAVLTVTANNAAIIYGSTNPIFTASFTNFANGEILSTSDVTGAPAITTVATTNSPIGTYILTTAIGTLASTNYTFVLANGSLTVIPATLTVIANSTNVTYGAANPLFTASYSNFVNGDTAAVLSGTPNLTSTRLPTSPVAGNPYVITANIGTLNATNYTFAFVSGSLTVTPAPLTVTANNATMTYGSATPAFIASYSNFVNGETISTSDVVGAPLILAAGTNSPVGSYPLTTTIGTLASTNYTFVLANGSLTVTPAALTVIANSTNVTYGTASPLFTASYSNFVNGDTVSVLSGSPSLASTRLVTSPVAGNPYIITAAVGTLSATNYTLAFVNGALTVTPAPLTVTADDVSIPYGATNPVFTASFTNFVNGETNGTSDVIGAPIITTLATTNSPVGTYDLAAAIGTLTSTNYAFVLVDGSLLITNAVSTNSLTASTNPALPGATVVFTSTLMTLAPSAALPYGSVQFLVDGITNGLPVSFTNGVATLTNSTLSHGTHILEADFAGDTNILGSTNVLLELIDTPPVAGLATFPRTNDAVLQISITSLLTNATDADGDALTLLAFDSISTNGATLVTNGAFITYTQAATNGNVTDSFTYTVADSFGLTNTGTVLITVIPPDNGPPVNITGVAAQPDGTIQINFAGVPNHAYLVEATTNLIVTNWVVLTNLVAGTNGLFQFTDLAATNYPARYYRTAKP